mmetsp:Transcript_25017/g.60963  ORF Transcript_25017/g.60963 Transcript_25017/m.60963 type:complete len:307 (-) Transcript_25017:86-1006(-)
MAGEQEDDSNMFELRNDFLIGAYQSAINHAEHVTCSSKRQEVLKASYVYRCFIAQRNYVTVLGEVASDDASTAAELRAVAAFARYMASERAQADADAAAATLKALMAEGTATLVPHLVPLMAAHVHAHAGNVEEALRCVRAARDNLEALALSVQLYLRMDRPDLAEQELKAMMAIDEDATVTQLATAWVYVAAGGERYQDALYVFYELAEKFTSTALLLNAMAVCRLHMDKLAEAEQTLLEALEKDSQNADTLSNLVCVAQLRGKSQEVIGRYLAQLEKVEPHHPWLAKLRAAEQSYERNADKYQI